MKKKSVNKSIKKDLPHHAERITILSITAFVACIVILLVSQKPSMQQYAQTTTVPSPSVVIPTFGCLGIGDCGVTSTPSAVAAPSGLPIDIGTGTSTGGTTGAGGGFLSMISSLLQSFGLGGLLGGVGGSTGGTTTGGGVQTNSVSNGVTSTNGSATAGTTTTGNSSTTLNGVPAGTGTTALPAGVGTGATAGLGGGIFSTITSFFSNL